LATTTSRLLLRTADKHVALAIKLFQEGVLSLGRVAKLAGLDYGAFVEGLGTLGIPAVGYAPEERDRELAEFERDGRRRRRSGNRLRSRRAD
jgi:predicted HTH domain antitoxin